MSRSFSYLYLFYCLLAVALGIGLVLITTRTTEPHCLIIRTGERTVIQGCGTNPELIQAVGTISPYALGFM